MTAGYGLFSKGVDLIIKLGYINGWTFTAFNRDDIENEESCFELCLR
jgi:hypothetical protein